MVSSTSDLSLQPENQISLHDNDMFSSSTTLVRVLDDELITMQNIRGREVAFHNPIKRGILAGLEFVASATGGAFALPSYRTLRYFLLLFLRSARQTNTRKAYLGTTTLETEYLAAGEQPFRKGSCIARGTQEKCC